MSSATCELRTLLFNDQPARAQLVSLHASWQRIANSRDYPAPVRQALGELVAASLLLSASLKFDGALVLQVRGDGPVSLMVAECSSDLGVRATALYDTDADWSAVDSFDAMVNTGGEGRFILILDPRNRQPGQQPYQGIIALQGGSLAHTLENYMQQSEQLQTRLWLQASETGAAGLLLQRMPEVGGLAPKAAQTSEPAAGSVTVSADDAWNELTMLAQTVKADELLNTDTATMAHRLFWQQSHQTLQVRQPQFRCSCSREKVAGMLRSLGRQEVDDALADQGTLQIHCDYCNTGYTFDAVDCAAVFTDGIVSDGNPQDGGRSTTH